LAIWRAEGITIGSINSNQLQFGQKFFPQDAAHNLAFCSYLHYFPQDVAHNWAAVPGRRFSNSPTSQSPIVGGKHIATLYEF
jgi:hypothetical protein